MISRFVFASALAVVTLAGATPALAQNSSYYGAQAVPRQAPPGQAPHVVRAPVTPRGSFASQRPPRQDNDIYRGYPQVNIQ